MYVKYIIMLGLAISYIYKMSCGVPSSAGLFDVDVSHDDLKVFRCVDS